MKLVFFPIRTDQRLDAWVEDDVLVLNGDRLDFSGLSAGSVLSREASGSDWIAAEVTRDAAGVLTVPLLLPHGATAPHETLFPDPVTVSGGAAALPPYDALPTLGDPDAAK